MARIEEQLARYGRYLDEVFESGEPPGAAPEPPDRWPTVRWLVGAAVLAVVAVIGGLVVAERTPAPTDVAAGRGATIALVPAERPDGLGLVSNKEFRFFGFDNGLVLGSAKGTHDPAAFITIRLVEVQLGASPPADIPEVERTTVQGQPGALIRSPSGLQLRWTLAGRSVLVNAGPAVPEAAVRRVAEGTVVEPNGAVATAWLPDGWARLWGDQPRSGWDATTYALADPTGKVRYDISTWRGTRPGDELGILSPEGAERARVRGRPALVKSGPGSTVLWWRASRLVVAVSVQGGGAADARRLAESLVPADQAAWSRFIRSTPTVVPQTTTTTIAPQWIPAMALFAVMSFRGGDASGLHLSDGRIQLLLDDRVVATRTAAELTDPARWRLPGGQSVLEAGKGPGSHQFSNGAGPPTACGAVQVTPIGLEDTEWEIGEPANIDSCADWFGVGVFVRDGLVVAIALYEPH
jgi:hypothetical protein